MGRITAIWALLVCLTIVGHLSVASAVSRHHSYFEYGHSILQVPHDRNRSTCPRDESRWAAEVLQEYVFSHLGRNAVKQLPPSCPLRPDLNMFSVEEAHRHHKRHGVWSCGFCKKKFRTDKYLEKHFERHHANMTPASANVCLADFCDALHCPWFHTRRFSIGKKSKSGSSTAELTANCLPSAAARAAAECEALADECFVPAKGRAWASMNRFFHTHFCGALTCDHATSERLLTAAHKATHKRGSMLIVIVVLVLLMILFYTGLLFYWTETRNRRAGRAGVGIGGRPGMDGGTGLRALGRGLPFAAAAPGGTGPSWLPPAPSWMPGSKAKNY